MESDSQAEMPPPPSPGDVSTPGRSVTARDRSGSSVLSTPSAPSAQRRLLASSPSNSSDSPIRPPRTPGDDSVVPATPVPQYNTNNNDTSAPGTPLTPLSDRPGLGDNQTNLNENDNDTAPAQQNIEDQGQGLNEEPIVPPNQLTLIRGTDVNVPTAAATFTEFLRTFTSLHDSERTHRRLRGNNDPDDDGDSLLSQESDSSGQHESNMPLYLSRLQHLLTNGTIVNGDNDNQATATTNSLDIDTMHLYYHNEACQRFYHQLVAYPMEIVPLMDLIVDKELKRLASAMMQQGGDEDEEEQEQQVMVPRVQVRPYNLRQVSNLRCLDPVSMDSLLSIRGMIVRTSPIIPDLKVAHFSCCICGHDVQVTIDRGRIQEPTSCAQCTCRNSFQLVHNRSIFGDKQMVRIQETPDEVPAGQTPASVVSFCFDDLVDSVKPGDRVEITGVLRAQPRKVHPKISKCKSVYKTYVDVIHFRRISGMDSSLQSTKNGTAGEKSKGGANESRTGMQVRFTPDRIRELKQLSKSHDIYDKLVMSVAPSIWELDNVKKGVLCMLFGGNGKRVKAKSKDQQQRIMDSDDDDQDSRADVQDKDEENDDSPDTKLNKRGDINILLCGDPGTSKSQLLSYVNKLSSRGVYTSGKGSSAVGLTASVVRDPETRELVLESGALVLSDLGICCIDEFDKMSDSTRSVLHEAMEQQTISIAKAGIIASLNARTSILASANPIESRYNPSMSVVENIQLPPTLLSRFDLIYLILDSPNADHDRRLAQHLVGLYYETPNVVEPPLDQALLRDYIDYARERIHPVLSDEATKELVASYLEMRRMGNTSANGTRTISATPRQLESLIRLSEGLAKMRYGEIVTRGDVKEAVRLMRVATQAAATDPRTGRIDMDMISTGRSTADRELKESLNKTLKELLAERRGSRMAVRDVIRQLAEAANLTVPHEEVVEALRRMEANGAIQFNERAQTIFVRTGIVS